MVNINGYDMVNDGQWSSGWWYTSEKYESHLGWLFPIYGKENVPNHQPVIWFLLIL